MSYKDDLLRKCVTVGNIPSSLTVADIRSILKKHNSKLGTVELIKIPGGEADENFEKFVVRTNGRDEAAVFYKNLQHVEEQVGEEFYTIAFSETTACEIPNEWLNEGEDLEVDGDPEQPPEIPEKPKIPPSTAESPEGYPSMHGTQPFAMSGFYTNVHGQGPIGAHGPRPSFPPGYPHSQLTYPSGPHQQEGPQQPFPQGMMQYIDPMSGQMVFLPPGAFPSMPYGPQGNWPANENPNHQSVDPPPYSSTEPTGHSGQTNIKRPFDEDIARDEPTVEEPLTKVFVSNLPDGMDKDYLEMFFENPKKSGGGSIVNLTMDEEEQAAIIEFEEAEVVQSVLQNQPFKIMKKEVRAELYQPARSTNIPEDEDIARDEPTVEEPLTKVFVSNLPDGVDKDYLEIFFETPKKSGGGSIVNMTMDEEEQTAIIEFEEAEVVQSVLQNQPFKIMKKEVRAELYQPARSTNIPEDDVKEEPITKIVVSDLPENADADFLEMFFENTRKYGGGDVADIEMNPEDAMAIIEFKEPEAVQKVLRKKPIMMLGVEIEVQIFEPEIVKDIAEDLLGGEGDPYKLLVTDLSEKADDEYLEMLFENKKKFGGVEVNGIEMFEEYSAALVEFSGPEDVQVVLSKQPIEVYKTRVSVYPYNPSKQVLDIIEVQGPADVMNGDFLEMYFESKKKSKGGDIVDLRIEENDEGVVAYIQFESEEVASRVVAKGSHKISKKELLVKLYKPPDPLIEFLKQKCGMIDDENDGKTSKNGSAAEKGKTESEPEPEKKTTNIVKVRGVRKSKSMDTIQFYFENTRRSGGGTIVDVKHDEEDDNVLFITFETSEVAGSVVEKGSHRVENCDLTVSLYFPPAPRPVYNNKVLVKGLKPTTTRDCLFNFLESKSGGSIAEGEQKGEDPKIRLVTFQNEIDYDRLQQNLKPLEGETLTICKVTVSNCIYISNYDESHGKDTLEFYFENTKRSGGGQIDKITFNEDKGYWLIYFNDYNVTDGVLAQEHTLHGQKLVVKLFIDCLGLPEGGEAQPRFKCPTPILISDAVPQKIKFLLNSAANRTAIEKQMEGCYCKVQWPAKESKTETTVKLVCTLTPQIKQWYKLAKKWEETACDNFNDYLKTIVVIKKDVLQDLWDSVLSKLNEITLENPDAVAVFLEKEQGSITVAGIKQPTEKVAEQINNIVKHVEEEAERLKQQVKETIASLKPILTKMLLAMKYPNKMEENYQHLKVKINVNRNELIYDGVSNAVQQAKLRMYELTQQFAVRECQDIQPGSLALYQDKQVKDYIVKALKKQNVLAVWEVVGNKLVVCTPSEDTIGLGLEFVRDAVKFTNINLTPANRSAVNTDKWENLLRDLRGRFPGRVGFEVVDMSSVQVSTTDDIEHEVVTSVKNFLQVNSILTDSVPISCRVNRLLCTHHRQDVDKIAKSFVSDHVQISWGQNGLEIRGNEQGVKQAKRELQQLASKVSSEDHTITKPGLGSYINSTEGMDVPKGVESRLPCVISIKGQEDIEQQQQGGASSYSGGGRSPPKSAPGLPTSMTLHAVCQTPDDRSIFTAEGDMTELRVDALVNTADKKLSLAGGLGKIIVKKGGKEIKEACARYIEQHDTLNEGDVFASPGGNLNVKMVIHVVGPAWQTGKKREADRLKEAVSKAMKRASMNNATSIAFPAISCGAFGFPAKVATGAIVQAIQNFFREEQDTPITVVYLCDVKPETIQGFNEALKQCFGRVDIMSGSEQGQQDSATRSLPRPSPRFKMTGVPVLPMGTPPQKKVPGTKAIIGNIEVTIVKGEIAKEKVDAIVNTTADTLDLTNGAVSQSLLKAAGQNLQDEVTKKHPNKIQFGEIVTTQGYKLKCKMVMHTALQNYDGGPSVQTLKTVMNSCLSETDKNGFTSIAFPAIGTGNLKFPRDVVAKEMFTAVENFTKKNPQSSISKVKFVVYHQDTTTIQAFEKEELRWMSGTRTTPKGRGSRDFKTSPLYQTREETAANENEDSGSDTDYEKVDGDEDYGDDDGVGGGYINPGSPYGNIRVVVKGGDITQEACDCIVNSSNKELDLSRGAVSQALLRKGGPQLKDELDYERATMKKEHIALTNAPNMHCGKIMHVVAQESNKDWKRMIDRCLKLAEDSNIRCIAFPALGTSMSMKASEIAKVMVTSIIDFSSSNQRNVQEVRLVIFQKDMQQEFQKAVDEAQRAEHSGYVGKAWGAMKAMVGYGEARNQNKGDKPRRQKGKHDIITDSITFTIYAMSTDTIRQAITQLETMLEKGVYKKEFKNDIIKRLDKEQETHLKTKAGQYHVNIKINKHIGLIEIAGYTHQVMCMTDDIHELFRGIEHEAHQRTEAELIANMIQWFFIDITETGQNMEKYEDSINRMIEKAYRAQEKSVEIKDNEGNIYVIDFAKMEEYEKKDPTSIVKVVRRDLIKNSSIEPPETWDKMGESENLKVVNLQPTSQEYKDLETKFKTSSGANYTITKIERVQNRTLWQQYQAKKKQLSHQNPRGTTNERQLWHGFAVDAMDSINAHGFNRSYCGKNATVYGDGVYFAVNANYSCSDTYSRPDASGMKHVYYSQVLTGVFTTGGRGMRVPPARTGSGSTALFDSVVDSINGPSMYIIFNDTQAYPEYCIHFKR